MTAKVHVIFYSTYGHVYRLAEAVAEGARSVADNPGVCLLTAKLDASTEFASGDDSFMLSFEVQSAGTERGRASITFLPETGEQEAVALAERLRSEIAAMRIPHEAGATAVTASFGIAQKVDRHITLDALIAAADECLYLSKQQGRNRVTTSLAGQAAAAQTPERPHNRLIFSV